MVAELGPTFAARASDLDRTASFPYDNWEDLKTAGLFLHADTDFAAPFVAALGLATAQGPTGPYLKVGAFNVTSRAGIFAAGDITRPAGILTPALSDGVVTGTASHQSLLWPERFPPLQET